MNLYKSFAPADLKLSEEGAVLVAFSRLNAIDKEGDVTLPGAIPTKDVAMSAFNHASWEGALPVGRGTVKEQGDLGVFSGSFFMQTDQGRNAYHTIKAMADLQEWSYGYRVLDGGPIQWEGKSAFALRKLDIHEVSPVLKGMGNSTATLAIKSGSPGPDAPYADHLAWVSDEVEALITRSKDRADWRAKEGRVLSSANRTSLATIATGLESHAGEIRGLLDATDPQKASRDLTLEVLLGIARRNGVPV